MEPTIDERLRHLYCGGKTGVGKSVFLESLAYHDIRDGRGFAFIDPHGPSADRIADAIPAKRIKDLAYFHPTKAPIAFNPLAGSGSPALKASNILETFKALWWPGETSYPLTEWVLLYSLIVLAERPRATLLDLPRLLADEDYRAKLLKSTQDDEALRFWRDYFPEIDKKDRANAFRSINNKLGQFLAFPEIRRILGTPPRINLITTMDEGTILLLNLSKGAIGSKAANLLGGLFLSSFYTASFSRKNKTPYYLYVDECRNFPHAIFEDILAEARKNALGLTLSAQALTQLNDDLQEAIIANCATLVLFRLGATDARRFSPELNEDDFIIDRSNFAYFPDDHSRGVAEGKLLQSLEQLKQILSLTRRARQEYEL